MRQIQRRDIGGTSSTESEVLKFPQLRPKKLPSQERSRLTFDALVEACAQLLARHGYVGVTTNHVAERAGVGVASLYEYFPGKDAIIAQVATRLIDRVFDQLSEGAVALRGVSRRQAIRGWIELLDRVVERERALLVVFLYEVPYTRSIEAVHELWPRMLAFSLDQTPRKGDPERDLSPASLYLLVNLVSSTILQLAVDPPEPGTRCAIVDELVRRCERWEARSDGDPSAPQSFEGVPDRRCGQHSVDANPN